VSGTTVIEIERRAGLSSGAGGFYRHFRSKEELVVPAFEHRLTRLIEARAEMGLSASPAEERDTPLVLDLKAWLEQTRAFYPLWLLVQSEHAQYPELLDVFRAKHRMLEWDWRWNDNPAVTIAIATLTGYNQLALMGAASLDRIGDQEFLAGLEEMLAAWERANASR
jgi:AcrR family transcriptional regulator